MSGKRMRNYRKEKENNCTNDKQQIKPEGSLKTSYK
jgi:NADH:ubiquinone oxidoreductase subunit